MQMLSYHLQSAVMRLSAQLRYQLFDRKFRYTLHIGLIVSTLLLAVLASAMMSQRIPLPPVLGVLVVGLVIGLTAFVLMYNYMEGAVVLLFVSTMLGSINLGQDITPTFLIALALTFIWIIKILLAERSFRSLRPTMVNRTALLFILAVIIAYIWSTIYVSPLVRSIQEAKFLPRFATLLVLIISPTMLLLFGNFVRSPKSMQRLITYYLAFGSVAMVLRLLNLDILFVNVKGQWLAWIGVLGLSRLLFSDGISRLQRLWLAVAVSVALFIALGLGFSWVSGWFPLAVGVAVVAVLRTRWAILAILIVVAGLAVLKFDSLRAAFEEENTVSGQVRVLAGGMALEISNEHFLFGTGPTGYYFYINNLGIYGVQLSHNNYIDVYAQTGIVGLTAWMAMWSSVGWLLWRGFRMTPPKGLERTLSATFLACYVTTMISGMLGDWITPFTYTQTVAGLPYTIQHWIFAGLGLSLYQHLKAQPTQITIADEV